MKRYCIFRDIAIVTAITFCSCHLSAQNRADRQSLEDPESFTMILYGDPQGYNKYDINQPIFELTTLWTADNKENLNIKAVLCTGDIVEQNENITLDRNRLNQTSRQMWEAGSRSFARLDGKLPYIICGGNHEYGYKRSENGSTHFPDYFPVERNSCWADCLVANYPNREGRASLENAAFEFKEPHWGLLLVICTEFAPRDEVLDWARKICRNYVGHKVILLTHSFLQEKSAERTDNEKYLIEPRNWGAAIWDKLVYPSSNIVCVICGHTGTPGSFDKSVAYREDKNAAGRTVCQMMFNVQILGGGWEGNGGDGWLRILEFMPDGKSVKVRTYSPLFGISPSTRHLAHRVEPFDQFVMVLE